jgi:hypothetical protein
MKGKGPPSLLRHDFSLVPDSTLSRCMAARLAKPDVIRMLLLGLASCLLPAAIACAAPQSQSSLMHSPNARTQSCADYSTRASPPLFISAHRACCSPSSLASCANPPASAWSVVRLPVDLSPKQASFGNTNDQPKRPAFAHPFWDRENDLLFAAVGASRTLDYFSTLNFRRRGRNEALLTNDVVDNHAAFASIEAAATVASIGLSYVFHRYHHHRLERWTSIVHASLATSGAVRNYCLKTAHP